LPRFSICKPFVRKRDADGDCAAAARGCSASPLLARVEFLGEMSNVLHSRAPLPLIPPAPCSHTGRRGRLGVLMRFCPPVRLHAGETPALPGGDGVDRNSFRSPAIAIAPQCSHTGRRGSAGRPDALLLPPVRLHVGETPALPGGASVDRNSFRSPAIAIAPQCSHTGRRGRAGRPDALLPPCEAARGRDARAPRRRQRRPQFMSVARDCGRVAMTTTLLCCAFAPHPSCPLLPRGVERGG